VELAVLVDRGGRELPVEATYCGVRLAVAHNLSLVLAKDGERLSFGVERSADA
jgi:pyrimidine operon attenuation protein / uracil phosphoribosyltransferase